jgi:uncharacterized membrane protein YcaP (DUF421 family)
MAIPHERDGHFTLEGTPMILIAQQGLLQLLTHDTNANMWQMPLSVLEKVLRPVIVYLALIILLRIFGKRELAQLNPFDLVVLLSLSNTVQNAIIGNDNSVSGGIIGAISLLSINYIVAQILFKSPKLTRLMEGTSTVLIREGKMDKNAMKRESLTEDELLSAVHKQGFQHLHEVGVCQLDPNGTFYVEAKEPGMTEAHHGELLARFDELTKEMAALRAAFKNS